MFECNSAIKLVSIRFELSSPSVRDDVLTRERLQLLQIQRNKDLNKNYFRKRVQYPHSSFCNDDIIYDSKTQRLYESVF